MNSMMVLRLLHCFYLLSLYIYSIYIISHPLFPSPRVTRPRIEDDEVVVSMARVEELNVSHVALWKWRSERGAEWPAAMLPVQLWAQGICILLCLALLFLFGCCMAPAPESARARPPALRRAPLARFTLLSCITVVQICYTVVMVTNSSSTKKRPFRCSARVTRAQWCHPIKLLRADHFGCIFFLLLSSRVDFFFLSPHPPHLGLHLCNGAHQSYFQFGSLVLGSPIWFMHSCRFIVSMNW